MAQSTYGDQTLPTDGNVAKGFDGDTAAIVTAIQNLSKMITSGTAAPSAATSTPRLYLRTNGSSVAGLYMNPGGNTYYPFTYTA